MDYNSELVILSDRVWRVACVCPAQVHDELVLEVPTRLLSLAADLLRHAMENVATLRGEANSEITKCGKGNFELSWFAASSSTFSFQGRKTSSLFLPLVPGHCFASVPIVVKLQVQTLCKVT